MVISNRTLERIKIHHIILTQYYGLVIDTVPKLRQMVWALNHFNIKHWSRCIYWEDFLFIDEEMLNWIVNETGDYKMDCSIRPSSDDGSSISLTDTIWDETSVADREMMEIMVKNVSWMKNEIKTFSWKEHIKTLKGIPKDRLDSLSAYLKENEENYFIFEYEFRIGGESKENNLSRYLTELRNKKIENIIYE